MSSKRLMDLHDFKLKLVEKMLMKTKIRLVYAILTPSALVKLLKEREGGELLCVQAPLPWQAYFMGPSASHGEPAVFVICADLNDISEKKRKELEKSGWKVYKVGDELKVVKLNRKVGNEVELEVKVCMHAPVVVEERGGDEPKAALRYLKLCKRLRTDEVYLLTCDAENSFNCYLLVTTRLVKFIEEGGKWLEKLKELGKGLLDEPSDQEGPELPPKELYGVPEDAVPKERCPLQGSKEVPQRGDSSRCTAS